MYFELFIITVFSFIFTFLFRRYAIKNNVLDIPNNRSSHSQPTPRGGGMAIVICFLGFLIFWYFKGNIQLKLFLSISIAGAIIAFVGFLDDHKGLSAKVRIIFHFLAAILIVFSIGENSNIKIFSHEFDMGWISKAIAVFFLVWALNMFNFMDGIDGLAASEAVFSSFIMGVILAIFYRNEEIAFISLAISACSLGFLLWNFPPAKIFMGDAGSGFLGIMLGTLILLSLKIDQLLFWSWAVVSGVFVVDSTVTLLRRALNGAKIYEAHRSHAYQYTAQKYNSHMIVTSSVVIINLFWLTPISYAIITGYIDGFFGLIIAYVPLIILAIVFKAGKSEENN